MITLTYHCWVEIDLPGGPAAERWQEDHEFHTDDIDHAHELAVRRWEEMDVKPARYVKASGYQVTLAA